MKKTFLLLKCLLSIIPLFAQSDFNGSWKGYVQYNNSSWPLRLHIEVPNERSANVFLDLPSLIFAEEAIIARINKDTLIIEMPFGLGKHSLLQKEGQLISQHANFPIKLSPDSSPPYHKEEVEWNSGQARLKGQLYLPESKGPFPLMIRLHGAATGNRQKWEYRSWADYFARLGIAVLIFDRRGEGESEGTAEESTFHQLAVDVINLIEKVKQMEQLDTAKIILGGGSQAAYVATIAHQLSGSIDYLILSSASATEVIEQEYWALKMAMQKDKRSFEEIQQALAYQQLYFHYVRTGRNWPVLASEIERLEETSWMEYLDMPRSSEDLNWWKKTYSQFQPEKHLKNIKVPSLFIYGEEDTVTPPQIMVPILKGLLNKGEVKDYEVYQFEGAGHDLEMRPGLDLWGRFLWPRKHPEILKTIEEWLERYHILNR